MPAIDSPARMTVRPVPYAAMPSFSRLFTTYCTAYARLDTFFAGDWHSPEARRAAAERAARHPRDRHALADILLDQNEAWGLDDAARAHIEALRTPEAVAVVTGQQVGLLTGPLYTPYKTITTMQLAAQLAEETGRPVVPVFWLEGSDHDFEEVASVKLLRHNEPVTVRYTGHTLPEDGNLGPVGRLVLTEQIEEVVAHVEETLPPSDFHDRLMAHVRDAYRPGVTLLDAFARLMRALFPEAGLVFINPDDARLKRLASPLFRREIEDYATSARLLDETSERLADDFHVQVRTRPTNLFVLDGPDRYPIDATDGRFTLRGTETTYSRDELLALLDESPDVFSPNVVLRPLYQDTLLPTAAYVGGPGEVSYFAQFKPLYAWAEVPMPIIYPRASVSLVESKVQKVLDRAELDVAAFEEDLDQLFQRVVLEATEVDIDGVFKAASRHLHEAVNTLKPDVEQVDRTLIKAVEATRAALMKEWGKLQGRVVRAEKQKHDQIRDQLAKAQVNLYPGSGMQERTLSVLYFLNKYGLDLLARLQRDLDFDTSAHQAVEL